MISQYAQTPEIDGLLFIMSANNSGSTLLRKLLEHSKASYALPREGQHISGFVGPSSRNSGARLLWASNQKWLDLFTDKDKFDWSANRAIWENHAIPRSNRSSLLITSSPPFLLHLENLRASFENPRFIIMLRNPYASVASILKRRDQQPVPDGVCAAAAANHIVNCFKYQAKNVTNIKQDSIFVSYEQLCNSTSLVQSRIQEFIPEMNDLDFSISVSAKGNKKSNIENMNRRQIDTLSKEDSRQINLVFSKHEDLLNSFGYHLINVK